MSVATIRVICDATGQPVWEERVTSTGNLVYVQPGAEPYLTEDELVAALSEPLDPARFPDYDLGPDWRD